MLLRAAQADVTPQPGHAMAGYIARGRETALGTHDPLRATLICLGTGTGAVAWLCLDAVAVDVGLSTDLRSAVARALAVPADNVVVCASHTHSGPEGWTGPLHPADEGARDAALIGELVAAVDRLARQAAVRPEPVEAHWCLVPAPNAGANRHHPDGWHDNRTGILALRAPGGGPVRAMLFDYASHPTVLGPENLHWSADWPGLARHVLEEALTALAGFTGGGQARPIVGFLQGPAGDASPRLLRRGRGFTEVARIGAILSGTVLRGLHDDAQPLPNVDAPRVHRGAAELHVRPLPTPEHAARQLAAAQEAWCGQAGTPEAPDARIAMTRLEGARRQQRLSQVELPETMRLPMTVVSLGEVAWLHLPVEPFGTLAARIARDSPFTTTRVIGYSDGYFGYVADEAGHEAGTYEALSSLFSLEESESLVRQAIRLAHEAASAT